MRARWPRDHYFELAPKYWRSSVFDVPSRATDEVAAAPSASANANP